MPRPRTLGFSTLPAAEKREYWKARYRKNRQELLLYKSEWRKSHRLSCNTSDTKWRRMNPSHAAGMQRAHRAKIRGEVLQAYGGKCTCCGESKKEFLCIDHVRGDGAQHRKELNGGGGRAIYAWLKANNFPKDGRFRLLCHNCNMSLGFYGYCPHNKENN